MKYALHQLLRLSLGLWMGGIGLGLAEDTQPPKNELLTPVQERMRHPISIEFRDTPIDDVLLILAKQADVDIIKSPKVIGNVTATLTDIPLSEALENILAAHGYAFITTANMIRVVPREDVLQAQEKKISRVYRITYADVTEVEESLKKFISEGGSISANPGTSNIIVTDVESKIEAIDSFIEEIDRVTPQILVEARIYDVSSKDRIDLGVQWQAGTATSYGAPTTGTLGSNLSDMGNVIHGVPTDSSPFSSVTNPHATGTFSGNINNASNTNALMRFGILNEHVNIDAILRAEQEDIRAKLLANPRIMVLDNQQAQIKIVEEIPYQELTETSGGGAIGTTQFRDVGVELLVTPHLTREGLIRLILNPKFSVRTGDVLVSTGNNNVPAQPIIATRQTMTTALIRDQQTVVIGGMRKQDVSTQVNKVPLLGDIPLLGELFKFRGESIINSELVVFITPQIVTDQVLTAAEQVHLENTHFDSPKIAEPKLLKDNSTDLKP
ncbi:secretin N-terminal domain-containing protein [Anaerohalosphaeraceae bacterium U12dextr]